MYVLPYERAGPRYMALYEFSNNNNNNTNDLDCNITSNVLKFVDDTKVFRKVNNDGVKQHLQNDLDKLDKWSEKWEM